MKRTGKPNQQSGMTLIEVTIAASIFFIALVVSAQSLMGFYRTLNMQKERIEAAQSARAVMDDIRLKRDDYQVGDTDFDWDGFVGYMDSGTEDNWPEFIVDGDGGLYGHEISVGVQSLSGGARQPGDATVEVHVESTWTDIAGRELSVEIIGYIAER